METLLELPILKLIKQEESHFFELKGSLKYDYKTGNSNPDLEYEVAKAIVAFMNADGGILLIGVHDMHGECLKIYILHTLQDGERLGVDFPTPGEGDALAVSILHASD